MAPDGWAELSKRSTLSREVHLSLPLSAAGLCAHSMFTLTGVVFDKPFEMQSQVSYSDPAF